MQARVCAVVVLLALAGVGGEAWAQAPAPPAAACAKTDFEAVVNAAGAALRDLKQQNLPQFQAKLLQLKDKRSWSNDELPKQVETLVRDEKVVGYDKTSEELVARISGGSGQQEADSAAPNCTLLTSLQADLKLLVEAQQAKWSHMLAKVDQELAK